MRSGALGGTCLALHAGATVGARHPMQRARVGMDKEPTEGSVLHAPRTIYQSPCMLWSPFPATMRAATRHLPVL